MKGKVLKGTRVTARFVIWNRRAKDGYEVTAVCAGCEASEELKDISVLDGYSNVPQGDRFKVGRALMGSVECPMPGPSHVTVIRFERQAA